MATAMKVHDQQQQQQLPQPPQPPQQQQLAQPSQSAHAQPNPQAPVASSSQHVLQTQMAAFLPAASDDFSLCNMCQQAQLLYNEGRTDDAEKKCMSIQNLYNDHCENMLLLGAIKFSHGDFTSAYNCNRFVATMPHKAKMHFARGYSEMGNQLMPSNPQRAREAFRCALAIDESLATMWNNMGNACRHLGDRQTARRAYEEALRLQPSLAVAHNNYGCFLIEEQQTDLALQEFRFALSIEPYSELTVNNVCGCLGRVGASNFLADLGNQIKCEQNRATTAMHLLNLAVSLTNNPFAHAGIGWILHHSQNFQEAVAHYRQAIQFKPDVPEFHTNLGHLLRDMGDLAGARGAFASAVRIRSSFGTTPQVQALCADEYNNLACVSKDLGIINEAITYYRKSLELKPDNTNVFCNLAHSLQMVCDWVGYDERMRQLVDVVTRQIEDNIFPSVHPHHTFLYPLPNSVRRAIASAHAEAAKRNVAMTNAVMYSHDKPTEMPERLKIGYVSSDFKDHPTSHLMQSVPGYHDRTRFEIFCYSLAPDDGSEYRKKIEREVEHFVDLSAVPDNAMAAAHIHKDGVHILINLNGYTKGARSEIFCLRPSPVQAMWLGYPGSSGADFMDYIITDKVTTPPEHWKDAYTEHVVYMPDTFFVGDHANMFPLPPTYDYVQEEHDISESAPPVAVQAAAATTEHPSQASQMVQASQMHPHWVMSQSFLMSCAAQDTTGRIAASLNQVFINPHPQHAMPHNDQAFGGQQYFASPYHPFPIPYVQTNYIMPSAVAFPAAFLPGFQYVPAPSGAAQMPVAPAQMYHSPLASIFTHQGQFPHGFQQPPAPQQMQQQMHQQMQHHMHQQMQQQQQQQQQQHHQQMQQQHAHQHQMPQQMQHPHALPQQMQHQMPPAAPDVPGGPHQPQHALLGHAPAPIRGLVQPKNPPPKHAPLKPGSDDMTNSDLSRPLYGLPEDKVILCNFNQLYKIDPMIFDAWIKILKAAPNTVLWLLRFPPAGEENLLKIVDQAGLGRDRVVFSPVAGKIEHVRRGALADMCLDTHACNGHTTGMDILWAGTPMVTLPGDTLASRVASSLLKALGFPQLIAESRQDYVDKVVFYATYPKALRSLQREIRVARKTSALFNTRLLVRNLEQAYIAMWRQQMKDGAPAHLEVKPAQTDPRHT